MRIENDQEVVPMPIGMEDGLQRFPQDATLIHSIRLDLAEKIRLPLVSTIITNHNYGHYVVQAIESVASQTYAPFECIVVDDCSTDGSLAAICDAIKRFPDKPFKVIKLNSNRGQLAAMKAGLEKSSGVFVNFLDADDALLPEFLETHVLLHLNSAQSAAVSASDTIQIDAQGQLLEGSYFTHFKKRGKADDVHPNHIRRVPVHATPTISGQYLNFCSSVPPQNFFIHPGYSGWPVVASSSLVFRRSTLKAIMPKDTSRWRICADYLLYKLAHGIGGTLTTSAACSFYRRHGNNSWSARPVFGGDGFGTLVATVSLDIAVSEYVNENFEFFSRLLTPDYASELRDRDVRNWIDRLFSSTIASAETKLSRPRRIAKRHKQRNQERNDVRSIARTRT